MVINSTAPKPIKKNQEQKKVVIEESKKNVKKIIKSKDAPLTEDELINKIIKGEG